MVIMMWKKRMEVMRYNAKQPDYHDVMLKQYRTSATSSLSRAMIGWQRVNDVNVVSNYFKNMALTRSSRCITMILRIPTIRITTTIS